MSDICLESRYFVRMTEAVIDLTIPAYSAADKNVWIDKEEAMGILKITSNTTLQKHRDRDDFDYSKVSSKHFLYYKPSIISFIEKKANR